MFLKYVNYEIYSSSSFSLSLPSLLRIVVEEDGRDVRLAVLLGLLAVAAEAGGDDGGVDRPAPGRRRGAVQIGQTVPGRDEGQTTVDMAGCVKKYWARNYYLPWVA